MKVILFGATGMIGSGVLLECLDDARVTFVVSVTRRATPGGHPKLTEIVHSDFTDFSGLSATFRDADACFFCLGISSVGLSEAGYHAVTYEVAMAAARVMAQVRPGMTFCFVSGAGADSSEHGRVMWARVKGKTENAVLALPFRRAFIFRPGFIQPMKGVRSRTRMYQLFYSVMSPVTPLLRRMLPGLISTTVNIGQAMIALAANGHEKRILDSRDINRIAAEG